MSFSKETQALLAAARGDGPAGVTRDAMWSKLEVGMGLVPAAASSASLTEAAAAQPPQPPPSPPSVPPAGAGAVKSSAILKAGLIGGSVGSSITVAAVMLGMRVLGAPAETPRALDDVGKMVSTESGRSPSALVPIPSPHAESSKTTKSAAAARAPEAPLDPLSREASLVMDARQSLIGGDPARALSMARQARELQGQLGREALTLEVRALRALRRDAEADRAEMELRVRHPD